MGYLSKRKFEERENCLITGLLFLIPALTLLGTLGRSLDWRLDYLGEFKIQAACLSFALFILCAFKLAWGKMLVFLVFVFLNLALVASHSHLFQKEDALPDDSYVFSVLYQNLKGAEHKPEKIREMLDNAPEDFVLLTNVPAEIYRHLTDMTGSFQLQNQTLDTTGKMKLILARTPGVDRGKTAEEDGLWVSRIVGSRKLTLLLANFDDPWHKKAYVRTKQKVAELAEFARSRDEPVIVMGNFGASGWSWLLRDLETRGGLKPQGRLSESGTDKPLITRRPTDQIYTHPGIEAADIRAMDLISTGHNAISATFKIAPARKEIEFLELQPTLAEEDLLLPPA